MNIRKATLHDLDYIIQCMYEIGKTEEKINSDFQAKGYITNDMKSKIAGELIKDDYIIFLGEEDNKKAGLIYGSIREKHNFWKYKKVGYIDYIFIEEEYRNQGKAKELFTEISQSFKKKGVDVIRLQVIDGNEKALTLYQKLGFKIMGLTLDKKL